MGYPLPELPNCYQNGLLLKNITSAGDLIPAETPTPFRLVILSLLSAEWIRIKDARWKSPINTISQGFFSAWDMKQVLGSPSITNLAKPLSVEDAIAFFSKARFFLLCHISVAVPLREWSNVNHQVSDAIKTFSNYMSKAIHDFLGFAWLRSVIDPKRSHHPLNQSDSKRKPILSVHSYFPAFLRNSLPV